MLARLLGRLNCSSPSDFILGSKMPKMHLFAESVRASPIPHSAALPRPPLQRRSSIEGQHWTQRGGGQRCEGCLAENVLVSLSFGCPLAAPSTGLSLSRGLNLDTSGSIAEAVAGQPHRLRLEWYCGMVMKGVRTSFDTTGCPEACWTKVFDRWTQAPCDFRPRWDQHLQ